MKHLNRTAILLIRAYQATVSKVLPGRCRFYPSCSHYAIESFQHYRFHRALIKSVYRIVRCNPFSEGYFDPAVPIKKVRVRNFNTDKDLQ